MDDDIRELLSEEIASEIKSLSQLDPGSKEHSDAVDNLAKLYRLRIDETKNEMDYREQVDRDTYDDQFRRFQFHSEEIGRYIRLGLDAAGIILPLMFYAAWMKRGFEFEKDGTFTSQTFRGLFNKFRPTGK